MAEKTIDLTEMLTSAVMQRIKADACPLQDDQSFGFKHFRLKKVTNTDGNLVEKSQIDRNFYDN